MNIVGIDISKGWFDCFCSGRAIHQRFANTATGWVECRQWMDSGSHMVMEASGPYYLGLASWLVAQNITVSVVNPLVIRRYGQMKLNRAKTDAKDAQLIAEYGQCQPLSEWTPPHQANQAMRQLISLSEGLHRQNRIVSGQHEAFSQTGASNRFVMEMLAEQLERIQQAIAKVNCQLEQVVRSHYGSCYDAIISIPGIGRKTAILLICITDGFTRFDNARQLASYAGICPRIFTSGSSIKGRGAICKLGSSQLRKMLYMCSWTAKRCNPGCRAMYERMKVAGKPERVIKIAIAHKLLRQAFAVGTSGQSFNKEKALAA